MHPYDVRNLYTLYYISVALNKITNWIFIFSFSFNAITYLLYLLNHIPSIYGTLSSGHAVTYRDGNGLVEQVCRIGYQVTPHLYHGSIGDLWVAMADKLTTGCDLQKQTAK